MSTALQRERTERASVLPVRELADQAFSRAAGAPLVEGNSVRLWLLRQSLGLEKRKRSVTYSDLDHLAGTWSKEDAAEFEQNTAVFERVDEEMWK